MNQELVSRIREYMCAHRAEIVRDLLRLAAIPSVRSDAADGAPFGIASRAALVDAVALFRENGFFAECRSGNRYGIATYGEGEPTLALFGHTDVVPVGDDWELTSPFSPIQTEDGYLVGRGVEDNKAGIVTALYVMRAFRDLALPMRGRLLAFLGAAEETGMEDIEAFCLENPMPDISIVPDNEYPVCLGEKGICQLMARSRSPLHTVTELQGGMAYNVILDLVTLSVRCERELADAILERVEGADGISAAIVEDGLTLSVRGVSAHASRPDGSINAAKRACDLLLEVPGFDAADREILKNASALLSTVHGEAFGIEQDDAYFGRVTAANGIARIEDGHLVLTFDIRYGTTSDPERLVDAVRTSLACAGFDMISFENRPGFRLDEENPTARALLDTYRTLSGESEARPYYSGGGTYARHLKNAYSIGCAVPYIRGNREFAPGHGDIHQSDESIYTDALIESIAMTAAMTVAAENTIEVAKAQNPL